jgi:hypothetical protein
MHRHENAFRSSVRLRRSTSTRIPRPNRTAAFNGRLFYWACFVTSLLQALRTKGEASEHDEIIQAGASGRRTYAAVGSARVRRIPSGAARARKAPRRKGDREASVARASRGAQIKRSATERARDLLAGGRIDKAPVGSAIQALDEEIGILRDAIGVKTRQLDVVARDAAYEESGKLVPQFNEAMRAALSAMEALAGAFNAAAGLADELRRFGYRPSSVLLPDLAPAAARVLGDPELQSSEAFRFRRELEKLGVI